MTDAPQDALAAQLAKLRADYQARLAVELTALHALAAQLTGGEGDRARFTALHQQLHKLAGSGGAFGLAALSAAARVLEQRVQAWLAADLNTVDAAACRTLAADLAALERTAHQVVAISAPARPPALRSAPDSPTMRVWLVEDDALLGQQLQSQLETFNYQVRLFTRIDEAECAARSEQPDLLITDVLFAAEGRNATEALTGCSMLRTLDCPLLFISAVDDFQWRVRAARLGAVGYVLKPIDIPRLIQRIGQLFDQLRAPPPRVMIVDDDIDLATHMSLVLRAADMQTEVLRQPERIMDQLAVFQPDLVLMDVHMPDCTGPELAGVIRQHDRWISLPIVYLSAETDFERQISAMSRGGDDFLVKPMSDAALVAAVRVRVERTRQLAEQINKDSLTGLLKHASVKETAANEIRRAQRINEPVTLAMIDIDHFKRVNDRYGHGTGDLVISALAMLLRQRLRRSDPIGRYGGEEFLVVLPECGSAAALVLLDDIRRRFADLRFNYEGQEFTCTLSAGSATSPQATQGGASNTPPAAGHDQDLLAAADAALYEAKHGGRNRVCAAKLESQ